MKRKRNYSRFYAIAKAKSIDLDQHKEVLVSQFTGGRTSSLREMTPAEYEEMCECLQTGKQLGERLDRIQGAAASGPFGGSEPHAASRCGYGRRGRAPPWIEPSASTRASPASLSGC